MFTNLCRSHLRTVGLCIRVQARRNIGCSAVLSQTAEDPIQKLFVQKIREYAEKKKYSVCLLIDIVQN
ncbi:hypothetical protein DPMN_074126 [Dreissena polymorpha]|uniref:Uncharacterized protein n=1 Tax=Dreissena polymorpha TaxID=45954 RepID=A0A9D3YED3_DREPO|nr:hypothetical protein DPMN_074126 [Dreissena polymorpha]